MKDSLKHVAAVATTMDQTGVVLHFGEVRVTIPNDFVPFSLESLVELEINSGLYVNEIRV